MKTNIEEIPLTTIQRWKFKCLMDTYENNIDIYTLQTKLYNFTDDEELSQFFYDNREKGFDIFSEELQLWIKIKLISDSYQFMTEISRYLGIKKNNRKITQDMRDKLKNNLNILKEKYSLKN